MTIKALPRSEADRRDEKVAELVEFIRAGIAAAPEPHTAPIDMLLVAASVDSPVVDAVKSIVQNMPARAAHARVILASLPEQDTVRGLSCLAPVEIRWAQNPSLLNAHEQLVVGEATSWTGDCMRRDPLKRDAFQSFNIDSLEAAGWARVSFDRLWQGAQPVAAIDEKAAVESAGHAATEWPAHAAMAGGPAKWPGLRNGTP